MILQTPRLYLRPMKAGDADALFAILGDTEAMRFWDRPAIAARAIAAAIVEEQLAAMQDGHFLYWTVCRGEDGPAIGSCDLSEIDQDQGRAQVGFLFQRAHWGRGYAREALRAVADHGLERLGLARLWARIQAGNEPARRVLLASDFAYEGRLRGHVLREGGRRDCEIYARLRE